MKETFAAAARWLPRLALTSLSLVLSCASSDEHDNGETVLLRITRDGAPVRDYVAILTLSNETVLPVSCPEEPTAGVSCTNEGLRVEQVRDTLEITVKVRGHEFLTRSFSLEDLPVEKETHVADLAVEPLPPFESNEDYTTGFELEDGLQAFQNLAYVVDTELGPSHVVKFYIHDIAGQPEVYFQNTRLHPLHHTFVRSVLGIPLSLAQFEATTYEGEERTAVAGTLVYYPAVEAWSEALGLDVQAPIALTFFPSDDLTPTQALHTHRLVEERLGFAGLTGGLQRVAYLPAGEVQEGELAQATELFARRGAAWVTHEQLHGGLSLQILNDGLAYGTLRLLSAEQLESAVVSFTDILVLSRLPNWLPVVAGTITEELQTPLAHVNVAARTRGTPNIALLDASEDPRVASLLGKLVRFEVTGGSFTLEEATLAEAQEFWDSRQVTPLVPEFDDTRDELPGFAELSFSDATSVGVKAANLAELSHVLGEQAPHGFAVPFYYYDQFMRTRQVTAALCSEARTDCTAEGRSESACDVALGLCRGAPGGEPELLWDHVARLLGEEQFTSNSEVREAVLDAVRYHIGHLAVDAAFAQSLDARVAEIFGDAKVRIRSSTNTEDLPNFSGAGLYRSVSAYATGDRAASDRIRKVWASVWNWRAFEEREFWNIDHLAVRMGCAVNQAFPDEAANGVLITQNAADPTVAGMYVNVQLGEVSVTNPGNGALAEVFSILPAPEGIQVARQRFSSLSPSAPILTESEIWRLFLAASQVQDHFAALYEESPATLALDLEFKFNNPDRSLVIKQARPYAQMPASQ